MGKPLSAIPRPEAAELAAQALAGRVTLYLGAGVSVGAPSNMPTSSELVALVRPILDGMGVRSDNEEGAQRTLEDIADDVEQLGRLGALKERLATMDVFRRPPNEGHSSIAILMSEGAVSVLSANWDDAIERAGSKHGFFVGRTVTDEERLRLRFREPLHKLHGCISRPQSLLISHADLRDIPHWARNEAEAAMAGGIVAFVGIGTVADYVGERVRQVLQIAGDTSTIWVVSRTVSDTWRELLESHLAYSFVESDADEFLDDLLRAIILAAFETAAVSAEAMIQAGAATDVFRDQLARFRSAFADKDAIAVWHWLTGGEFTPEVGLPTVHSDEVLHSMLAVALIVGTRNPVTRGAGASLILEAEGAYIEVATGHSPASPHLVAAEKQRVAARRAEGQYPDVGLPIVHVCTGHIGALPSPETVDHLVGGRTATSLVDGPSAASHYWVGADLVLGGQKVEMPWSG